MKSKRIYIALMCLFTVLGVQAQKEYKYFEYQGFGLRVGANLTTLMLQPTYTQVIAGTDWNAGLVYVFANKKYLGVQIEALYSRKQWKETYEEYSATTALSYVEIPIMTNIIFGANRFKYMINLGSFFAVKLSKDLKMDFPDNHPYAIKIGAREERGSDFGLLIGGALRYITKVGIFQFDVRYAYGYRNLYNEEASGFQYSTTSNIQAGLIYIFHR